MAFGQREGTAPHRFLVGLATVNLLAEVAEEAPLLCLVDDAQWLDQASAQVLAFVARRVSAEQMALVFAVRDHSGSDVNPFVQLPELRLDGLGEADARTLLAAAVRAPLADDVRDRIVAESRGYPLALLELPRGGQFPGGYELPVELLLLVATAKPTGDAALLWRAANQLGIAREAAAPAEATGLLQIGARVWFPHPLVRSAVYRAITRRIIAGCTTRWAPSPTPGAIPTGAPGTSLRRCWASTRTSPRSSRPRRAACAVAEHWLRRPRSCDGRSSRPRSRPPRRRRRRPRRRRIRPAPSRRPWSC